MQLTPESLVYVMVLPFMFNGELFPTGSGIIRYLDEHKIWRRFALPPDELTAYLASF